MDERDLRRGGAALLLLLALAGAVVDRRAPAWLREDPIARPFGQGAPGDADAGIQEEDAEPLPPMPVQLDRATEAELVRLPGIGPVTAGRILALRDSLGTIRRAEELLAVKGIGPKKLEQIRPWLSWPDGPDSMASRAP